MEMSILVVPYRLGHERDGTGLGPQRLSDALIFGGFFALGLAYLVARVSWRRFRPATTT